MATNEARIELGRLTFRSEGDQVVCRWAPEQSTMEGAVEYGRLSRVLAEHYPDIWRAWRELMQKLHADVVFAATGVRPLYDPPATAPEHERSGRS